MNGKPCWLDDNYGQGDGELQMALEKDENLQKWLDAAETCELTSIWCSNNQAMCISEN